ncbi:nicotinate phosphoribosyltransferase [Rothia uropygialis]|uniref:nicotinate phosphoribosyltransferase n=1 Tax=Kocuria sp. 36 TaxID=1415402 RepID=UPI00237BAA71|nr:nicotinate phosphoribosyltransferase [Kocuria sp. 36]
MRPDSPALLTDHYELTMLQAAIRAGMHERRCVFETFTRRLPAGRRYGILAGTGRFLEALEKFTFDDQQLAFLEEQRVVDGPTLDYLSDFRFSGSIRGYREGEAFFPHSPVLQVEAPFAEACVLETLLLSILNFDSAVASAASRMTGAAGDRPCLEMGSRRAHEEAAVSAARAAAIAGFAGTSNLEAGRRYGINTIGTSAHAFTLLFNDEVSAFRAQLDSLGLDTTLLVDTYDVEQAVRTAVDLAGTELGAVRLDSGDLVAQAFAVRDLLDTLGNRDTKITVTSDLDEYAIAGLAAAPVDSYGVGTRLVTGSGAPTSSMVYKMVARQDANGDLASVAKRSQGKGSIGGAKHAGRRRDRKGTAIAEAIALDPALLEADDFRPLMHTLVADGEVLPGATGPDGVRAATERHRQSTQELPRAIRRLSEGEPALPTEFLDH